MVLYLKKISCGSRIAIGSPVYSAERHIAYHGPGEALGASANVKHKLKEGRRFIVRLNGLARIQLPEAWETQMAQYFSGLSPRKTQLAKGLVSLDEPRLDGEYRS